MKLIFIRRIMLLIFVYIGLSYSEMIQNSPNRPPTPISPPAAKQSPMTHSKQLQQQQQTPLRPPSVLHNDTVNYFAVGSNLLLSKLTNRGINSTKINVLSFKPSYVPNYRLAFNLRGFPPLEPCMAGIYPSPNSTIHGALATLPREDYENLWMSEGGGMDKPSYEEVEVECYKYNEVTPVKVSAGEAKQRRKA